jgi:hypothetical protein
VQALIKPNCSPVGRYLIFPFAAPNAAAGCSQRQTWPFPFELELGLGLVLVLELELELVLVLV